MTPEDEHIFEETLRTGDLNLFTERYFRLPWSGTWFTPEDRPEQYEMLYDVWVASGKPDHEFEASIDEQLVTLKTMRDPYYGGYPMILLPHGFRMLPWLERLVSPQVGLGLAVTGAGSGKAQPLDAKILTPGGWTIMGEIQVGDCVVGQDGEPKKILGVYPQGIRPIYRVTFDDGSGTCVDREHLWSVGRWEERWRVKRTDEMRLGQDCIPKMLSTDTRVLKSVEFVERAEAQCIAVEGDLYVTDDYIVTHNTAGVCMAALSYAALYPGFRFLNVAPTAYQASLMLTEIEKWCTLDSPFRRFIKPSRGAHDLWIENPHPTITIEVWPGYPSIFTCQTVGRDASGILGTEQDWINCDEAVLLVNIELTEPKLGTRLRGTRGTGVPRWGKLTWITNPGVNPDFISLLEKYEVLAEECDDVVVMQDVVSSVNVYITKRQLERQRRTMSQQTADRWHGGSLAAAMTGTGIDQRLLDICKTERMNEAIDGISYIDDIVGLREYELEYEPDHHYVVAGDEGKCNVHSLSSMNVPMVMVFDVTDFLEKPHSIKLVAFYWMDGNGSYKIFLKKMKHAMLKYRAKGYYDATRVQSAFEDVGRGGFDGWPTEMIFFSGHVGVKSWAITIMTKLMEDRQFEWPYIRGLWHQARIFDPASKKRADDIIAAVLVFCLALRHEAMFWDKLAERYDWKEMDEEDKALFGEDEVYTASHDRHARFLA